MATRKTTVTIDDEVIGRVAEALGTHGIKDTIDAALREVLVQQARREALRQLRTLDGLDLDDPSVMAAAWRD
jgi:Arc/MetJ family transcription regulator